MKQYCSSTSVHYAAFTVCAALCHCAVIIRHCVHIYIIQTLCSNNHSKERDSGDQCSFFAWKDVGGEWDQQLIGQQQQLDIFEQLKNVFGHHRFRHGQEEVVRAGMRGRDVFVLIPTVSQ
jgi:superfamily II DNA helicase RecQ